MARNDGRPGRLAMPRTRGAASGLLILVLGVWGALIPFIGSAFDLVVGPDAMFDMTPGRFWVSLVPGVVAAIGGLMLIRSANRATATLGAQLALAAGVWFVVGRSVSLLWETSEWGGQPLGGTTRQALELLLHYYGIGAAITAFAGIALGRVSTRHAGDEERLGKSTDERSGTTGRFRRTATREETGAVAATEEPAATRHG